MSVSVTHAVTSSTYYWFREVHLCSHPSQITRNGEIISENSYRQMMARKEHQRHVRQVLAQAIVHKTLDMERIRQVKIKQKLEEISKIERVRRVKVSYFV